MKITDEQHQVRMNKRRSKRVNLTASPGYGSKAWAPERKGGPPLGDGFDAVRVERAQMKRDRRARQYG